MINFEYNTVGCEDDKNVKCIKAVLIHDTTVDNDDDDNKMWIKMIKMNDYNHNNDDYEGCKSVWICSQH